MENKYANTDYQKLVRVGEQKWEIVEITIGIILLLEVPPETKSPPPRVQITTQNPNLT